MIVSVSTGSNWLVNPTSPSVASTAVSASRTGMPAATRAPKATIRIASVSGIERNPARCRSFVKLSLNSFSELASPNCSTTNAGCAACAFSTVSIIGCTLSRASSGSPATWKSISAERPSAETRFTFSSFSGERTAVTSFVASSRRTTSATVSLNGASLAVSDDDWTSTRSPAGCSHSSSRIPAMRPDSPAPASAGSSSFMPTKTNPR
jgi:hypothetical protein